MGSSCEGMGVCVREFFELVDFVGLAVSFEGGGVFVLSWCPFLGLALKGNQEEHRCAILEGPGRCRAPCADI